VNNETVRVTRLANLGDVPKVFHDSISNQASASNRPLVGCGQSGDALSRQSYNESLSAQRLSL